MNLADIVGPIMVGPSSSHTAGAVRIGKIARKIFGEKIEQADIFFHGSFLATGKGHGTDKAVVAGLLGYDVDDARIPDSFRHAEEEKMKITMQGIDLGDVHPNSVKIKMTGFTGHKMEVVGASVGGGCIRITQIDGMPANFAGDYATLIVLNEDTPGHVAEVTSMLAIQSVNIATLQLHRFSRGEDAVMVIECDREIPAESIEWFRNQDGIKRVTYYSLEEKTDV